MADVQRGELAHPFRRVGRFDRGDRLPEQRAPRRGAYNAVNRQALCLLRKYLHYFTIVSAILEKRTEQEVELSSQFTVLLKKQLVDEFNSLNIAGMPKIDDLFPINGAYVNLAYPMPNGKTVKLLDDNDIYLGNQLECEFSDGELIKCYGLVAGLDFILVSEYGENCSSPEIVVYKKR